MNKTMDCYTILYNPLAGNGSGYQKARHLKHVLKGNELTFQDITKIIDYQDYLNNLPVGERLVICGGDGTLSRFVNYANGAKIPNEIFYFPGGSGNDFMRDLGLSQLDQPILIREQLQHIPKVNIKGKEYYFLNGVGMGLDGYCCQEGERRRGHSHRPINYTKIAVEGLLHGYTPKNATVIVDGQEYHFRKVWLSPTMNGRFFGGGMMPTPDQDRLNPQHTVSVMLAHDANKLMVSAVLPEIFKGTHIKYTKYITILTGHHITVRYDAPAPVQIDGEVIPGVIEYTVISDAPSPLLEA